MNQPGTRLTDNIVEWTGVEKQLRIGDVGESLKPSP